MVADQTRRIESASRVGPSKLEEEPRRSYAEAAAKAKETKPLLAAAKAAAQIEVKFEKRKTWSDAEDYEDEWSCPTTRADGWYDESGLKRPSFPKYDEKYDEEVLPDGSEEAKKAKEVPRFKMHEEEEEEDAELAELYKMLSVTDPKTKELESSMKSMSDGMGKLEKKVAAQTQMLQAMQQQMEVTNKAVQDMAAKHIDMMTMMASIQQTVVQLAQSDPKEAKIQRTEEDLHRKDRSV